MRGSLSPPLLCRSRTPTSVIFPFADDAAGLLFGGETLLQLQDRSARECGLQVVDVDDDAPLPEGAAAFVARDVVLSAATLRALLQHGLSSPVRAVVKSGTTLFEASTRLLEVNAVDLALPLWAGKLAGLHPGKLEGKDVVVADEDGAVVVDTSPLGVAPHQLLVADVERLLGRPTHWLHVLELSLAAARTRLRAHHPVEKRGKRSPRVHPTAYIANSLLWFGSSASPLPSTPQPGVLACADGAGGAAGGGVDGAGAVGVGVPARGVVDNPFLRSPT